MNGTRLDENWQPDPALRAWTKTRRPDLDIADTVEQFKDYWCAKTGKDATKLCWTRTFRNWVRGTRGAMVPVIARPSSFTPAKSVRRLSDSDRAKTVGEHLPAIMRQLGMKV